MSNLTLIGFHKKPRIARMYFLKVIDDYSVFNCTRCKYETKISNTFLVRLKKGIPCPKCNSEDVIKSLAYIGKDLMIDNLTA